MRNDETIGCRDLKYAAATGRAYHRGAVLDRTIIYSNYAMRDERSISGPQSELDIGIALTGLVNFVFTI